MKKFVYRKVLIILFFALLLAGAGVYYFFFYEQPKDDNKSYDEAQSAVESRNYSLALTKFKEAINEDPSLTDAYIQAADILLNRNQDAEAIELLEKGIDFANDPSKIKAKMADIYAHQANFEKALEYSDSQSKPGYLALLGRMDEAKKEAGNISGGDAYSAFLQAIVNYDNLEKARGYAQNAASTSDDTKYTILKEKLDTLEEAEDNKVMNYMEIANIAIQYDEGALAIIILNDVRTTNKYYEGSYIYEAYVRLSYGDYVKALELLKSGGIYAPNNQDIPKLMAEAYYEQNDLTNATKYIQKSLSFAQPANDVKELAFQIYMAGKDYTKALQQAEALVKASPNNYVYARLKSKAQLALGKNAESEAFLSTFIEGHANSLTNEQRAVLLALTAFAQYGQNEKKEAKDSFAQAEALFSNSSEVSYYYGLFYKGQGEEVTADEYFQKAVDMDTTGEIALLAQVELAK